MSVQWSKYQLEIFKHIETRKGSALLDAMAGSAKTSTLVECTKFIPPETSIFLAFNKHIQTELQSRLPPLFECKTMNALGYSIWRSYRFGAKTEGKKVDMILDEMVKTSHGFNRMFLMKCRYLVRDMVNMCKNYGYTPKNLELNSLIKDEYKFFESMEDMFSYRTKMVDTFKLQDQADISDKWAKLVFLVKDVLTKNIEMKDIIDFSDQVYFPIIQNMTFPKYDFILVDETQDLSRLNIEMIFRISKPSTIVIAAGDQKQSLYSWRGADTSGFASLKKNFNMADLPLPISYRCAKSIVKVAQEFNPKIEPWEKAVEGVVKDIGEINEKLYTELTNEDMVICRWNSPLFAMAMDMVTRGHKVHFVGSDLMNQMITLIKNIAESYYDMPIHEFTRKLEEWYKEQVNILKAKDDNPDLRALNDNYWPIKILSGTMKPYLSIRDLQERIRELFSSQLGVRFSTVHKSKGLEAGRVYFLDRDMLPSKKQKKEWQKQEEYNILYVGVTRAKKELYFMKSQAEFREQFFKDELGLDVNLNQIEVEANVEFIGRNDFFGEKKINNFEQKLNNKYFKEAAEADYDGLLPEKVPSLRLL